MREFYLLVTRVFVIIIEGDKIEKKSDDYIIDNRYYNKPYSLFK